MADRVSIQTFQLAGRRRATSGAPWELSVGYSRAVRAGSWIAVTGTVGILPDGSFPEGAGAQAARALEIIVAAIEALGGRKSDVVRTRMFVTDISRWEEVGRAHGLVFGEIRPATTMVEVARLIDERALIEIEADAVIGEPR
jgi:enamine deaminase RidA (YjgF/YER057c/UK114 family)